MEESDREERDGAPPDPALPPVLNQREDLEKAKLALEIRDLRRPWVLRAEYLSVLITLVLGVGTLAALYFAGVLDAKRENLEREKAMLTEEVRVFSAQRDQLGADRDGLKAETDQLQAEKKQLQVDRARLVRELAQFEQERARLEAAVRPLRESLGEILSAAEEGTRQLGQTTAKSRIAAAFVNWAEVESGEVDVVSGELDSLPSSSSPEERLAGEATQERWFRDYLEHERECSKRRSEHLASLPADELVAATREWLHEFNECLQGWVLPSQRNP